MIKPLLGAGVLLGLPHDMGLSKHKLPQNFMISEY